MQGNNPQRQIEIFDTFEPCLFHQAFQALLVRMDPNRFREIAVACLVASNHLAEAWNHFERVEILGRRQRLPNL